MSNRNPLAYTLRAFNPPHDLRIAAWLPCSKCESVGKVHINSWGNNPEKVEKHFNTIGWEANVHKHTNICPACVAKKKKQDELLRKEPGPKDVSTRKLPTVNQPKEKPMTPVSHTRTGGAITLKTLTPDHKIALRRELDAHFDDAKGRYIGDESDHTISERTKVPRAIVAEFRSLSYGDLKEDPEVAALRAALDQAKALQSDIQARISRAEAALLALSRR